MKNVLPQRLWQMPQDNENDEYHTPVPLPDLWAEYRRLKDEERWSVATIKEAKNVSLGIVSERIKYAGFPSKVLQSFFTMSALGESHARELSQLSHCENLTPWLTRDDALTEILSHPKTGILSKHRGGSEGIAPTAGSLTHHCLRAIPFDLIIWCRPFSS